MKTYCGFIFIILFLLGCSKDELELSTREIVVESKFLKLHQIISNGTVSNTFTYDDLHRVLTNSYDLGVNSFSYLRDTTFQILKTHDGEVINSSKKYLVDGNTIRQDHYDDEGEFWYYRIFKFNVDECGYSERRTYYADGQLYSYSHVEYIDSNCSYSETFWDSGGDLQKKITIMKNEYFSAFNSTRPLPLVFDINNEWQSRYEENAAGSINIFGCYNQTSVVNEMNYPTSMTSTTLQGLVTEYDYIYYSE